MLIEILAWIAIIALYLAISLVIFGISAALYFLIRLFIILFKERWND